MILNILSIIVAISLIVVIMLQMQGTGLSSSFGGAGELYRSRQSIDKILVWLTIILTVVFAVLSIILLLPQK
jgi:protein translocase SecG subunit